MHQRTFDRLTQKIALITKELDGIDPNCPFMKRRRNRLIKTKLHFQRKLEECLRYKPTVRRTLISV